MFDLLGFLRRKKTKRTPRQETGRAAEQAAERFLRKHGYRILARNVTYTQGEVDLVAVEKRTGALCFVEVRSRADAGGDPAVAPEETAEVWRLRKAHLTTPYRSSHFVPGIGRELA